MSNVIINPYNFVSAIPFPNTYSLDFDGVDDYVDLGTSLNSSLELGDSFTLSAWVKFSAGAADREILSNWTPAVKGVQLRVEDTEKITFLIAESTGKYKIKYSSVLAVDTWHFVVVTYDGSNTLGGMNIYINGVLDNDSSLELGTLASITSTTSLIIGGGTYPGSTYYAGNIDEVSIWGSALSSGDVSTLWNDGTPNNLNTALATTPVAWYRMGDSGEYFNGNWELPNQPQLNNWSSHSMTFDSVDDFVSMGDVLDFDYTDAFTFSTWIKYTTDVASNTIVCKMETSGDYRGYEFFVTSDHKLRMLFYNTASNRLDLRGGTILTADTWYHAAVTYSGGGAYTDMKIYLNGVAETLTNLGDSAITATSVNAIPFQIGARNSVWDFFNGSIDEVSLFDAALDASTITSIYNSGEPTDLSAFSLKSFKFDGVDDYVKVPTDSSIYPTTALSISIWVKVDALDGAYPIAGGLASGTGLTKGYAINIVGAAGLVYFRLGNGSANTLISGSVSAGVWAHILCVYDGTDMQTWVNGVTDGLTTAVSSPIVYDITKDLFIGTRYFWASHILTGSVDDVAIFNNDQSANASAIYNSGKPTDLSAETGLVGYWKFDDALYNGVTTEFSVPDSSTNSNTGTSVNMDFVDLETDAPLSPIAYYRLGEDSYWDGTNWWTPDYSKNTLFSEKSFNFDGVDDYINVGNDSSLNLTTMSISLWAKFTFTANKILIGKNYTSSYYINSAAGTVSWFTAGSSLATIDIDINDGNWHHILCTVSVSSKDIYVDGVSKVSGSSVLPTVDTNDLYIGNSSGYSSPFDGSIDEVAIFNNDQSANAATIYNSGVPTDLSEESGLVTYWRMGEGITNWNGTNWQLPDYSKNALYSQKSLNFDGVDDTITTGLDCTSATHPDISVICWLKTSSTSGIQFPVGVECAYSQYISIGLLNGGVLYYKANGVWVSGGSIADGNWHNIVWTFSYDNPTSGDMTVKVYKDGNTTPVIDTIDNGFQNPILTGNLFIGSEEGTGLYFNGLVDDVSVFNKIISTAEVTSIWNSGVPKNESAESGLIGYWRMGEDATFSTNWTIPDASTNSNDGTSSGMIEVDLEFNTPTNPNAGLSSGMDKVDLEFNTPTNLSAGLSSGMAIDDKVNNAPDNINQGLSSGMTESDKVEDTPP